MILTDVPIPERSEAVSSCDLARFPAAELSSAGRLLSSCADERYPRPSAAASESHHPSSESMGDTGWHLLIRLEELYLLLHALYLTDMIGEISLFGFES